jgi:hypothetical protein
LPTGGSALALTAGRWEPGELRGSRRVLRAPGGAIPPGDSPRTRFPSFARRCVARQLATALTAARRGKHGPLNEAARGADAQRACEELPGGDEPADRALADELLRELEQAAAAFAILERPPGVRARARGLVERGDR